MLLDQRKIIDSGAKMIIFPQGTRKYKPKLGEENDLVPRSSLKTGVAEFATKEDIPVIAVGIDGTRKNDKGKPTIVFASPITSERFSQHLNENGLAMHELTDKKRRTMFTDLLHYDMTNAQREAIARRSRRLRKKH